MDLWGPRPAYTETTAGCNHVAGDQCAWRKWPDWLGLLSFTLDLEPHEGSVANN